MERPPTEINVYAFLVRCWLNRLTFAMCTLVLALPTGIFVLLAPPQFSGSMTLKPLTAIEMNIAAPWLVPLATFGEETLLTLKLSEKMSLTLKPINEETLFNQFLSNLETQLIDRDIKFKLEVLRGVTGRKLTFTSPEAKLASLVSGALNEANQQSKSDLINMIGTINDANRQQNDLKIKELELRLQSLILSHQQKLEDRIKWMRAQAKIARELNIAEPLQTTYPLSNHSIVRNLSNERETLTVSTIARREAIYLLGYRAIEAEIEVDEATLEHAAPIPYPDGYELIRQIEFLRSKSEKQSFAIFQFSTEDGTDGFAASTNSFEPKNIKEKSRLIIFLVAIFGGFFIGFLITLGRMALSTRRIA